MFLASNIPVPTFIFQIIRVGKMFPSFFIYTESTNITMFRQSVLIQSHKHKIKPESKPKTNPPVAMASFCCCTKNDPFPVIPNSFPPQPDINLPICSTEKTYTSVACVFFFLNHWGSTRQREQVVNHQVTQATGKILK